MVNKLRLLQGATALLYVGPLLAGLGGFGWAVIPVFVAIFLLWLFILRPQQWPRRLADWARPEALVTLASQGAVQVLLVAVSFGIGRGIGGVLGALPPFPLMLPVAISFLSIPLARMIWDPWQGEALDVMLDDALARLEEGEAPAAALQAQVAVAGRMVEALADLPEATGPEVLEAHLAAMAVHAPPEALRVALMDPVYDGTAGAVQRRAAIVHATMPEVAAALGGSAYALAVFHELCDPEELRLFAGRCGALLTARPDLAGDCPDAPEVQAAALRVPEAAAALGDLEATLLAPGR